MPFTDGSEEHQAPPSLDQGGDDENIISVLLSFMCMYLYIGKKL